MYLSAGVTTYPAMPRFEKVCGQIWRDPDFRMKWLLGGLLGSIPLVNLIVGGYFLRYARQLRQTGDVALPHWGDWDELLLDAVRMLVLQIVFFGLPVLLGWMISAAIAWLLGVLYLIPLAATVAWVPFFAALAVGPPLWMAALHRYLPSQDWARVFDLPAVLRKAVDALPALAFPTLALWGLWFLGWPLLGFIFFLGFGPYVAYSTAIFTSVRSADPMG